MNNMIGIIGFGNMGSAISEQLKSNYQIVVFDKDKNKTKNVSGIKVANNIIDLINKVCAIILAVKPQDFDIVLRDIKDYVKNKLIISIAAGIATKFIEICLGRVRVIRAMPNLPAKLGDGMICLCRGKYAKKKDLVFATKLFKNLGKTLILDENMMDKATVISGSGPGYFYDWAEGRDIEEIKNYATTFATTLTATATSIGFSIEQARTLASVTTKGSIILLEKTNLSPSELKRQVASKGGTTEAALEVLHKGGTLDEAVKAALKRAKELVRKD